MKFKITFPFMKIKDNENYMNFSPSHKLQKKTIYNTLSSRYILETKFHKKILMQKPSSKIRG